MKKPAPKPRKIPAYDHAKIEKKWQKEWARSKLYKTREDAKKQKFYVLDMFPYPSGEGLHVGHPKGYIATDIVSRFQRMNGRSVLHPMGFDAFGLPAENYAIKMKVNPEIAVRKNVARYKKQLEILGFDYDWSREVSTSDPKFYRWTQWIFLQLFKKGLAHESYEPINWCPTDKTGLANEDIVDGRCERCGTLVEKKLLKQWVLKITDYADRMLADLDMKVLPNGDLYGIDPDSDPFVMHMNEKEPGKVRQDKPFVERDAISAFVEHWSEDKFIVLKWKKVAWMTPITGGIEKGQTAEEAARAEILEETGFKNLELVRHADNKVHSTFFHGPKDENRVGHFDCFHFKLKDGERQELAAGENENHEVTWVERSKMRETMTAQGQKIAWALLMDEAIGAGSTPLLDWPESIKEAQRNWIGRSEGVTLKFKVKDLDMHFEMYDSIPQTFMAQTFTVIAPEHKELLALVKGTPQEKAVMEFAERMKQKKAQEGFDHIKDMEGIFTGRYIEYAPANKMLPIWVASYAVADYGSGVVNCSAHDERDFAFAKKYDIPLHPVLFPEASELADKVRKQEIFYREPDGILEEPSEFKGRKWAEVRKDIIDFIVDKGWGTRAVQYKLRDWVFSRQRYWGEPIPVVHCQQCAIEKFKGKAKITLKVADQKGWAEMISGTKTLETRAINPDEKDRLFEEVKSGDILSFVNIKTKEERLFKVKSAKTYPSLVHLFEDKESLAKLRKEKFSGLKQLVDSYNYTPDYVQKIRENGLAAWEIETVTVPVAVPEKDLPVKLPSVKSYEPTGTGESPLAAISKWVNVKCPVCKGPAKRETNTMPQWAGSSWYYLRYEDVANKKKLVDPAKEKYWSPVDLYVGGAEHATRHLIYSRFWHKFLFDIGAVSTIEPFKKLQSVGLIMGEDGRKMSKRFGNVVNPDEIVGTYGADTMRLYEMFMGPFDQQIAWSTAGITGPRRFIERVWKLQEKIAKANPSLDQILHKTIKKVTDDIAALRFNTAVSSLMISVNEFEKAASIGKAQYESVLKLLAPFAPHVCDELWALLGNRKSIHISSWPQFDAAFAAESEATIVVQVNGKVRASFKAAANTGKEELEKMARETPEAGKWLEGKAVTKTVVVPGKLVNFVAV